MNTTHTETCYHVDCDDDDAYAHGCQNGACEECGAPMSTTHTQGPWYLANIADGYRDFECCIPDNENGVGGNIRITLADEQGQEPFAYGSIMFHSETETEIGPLIEFEIDRPTAEKVVGEVTSQAVPGSYTTETGKTQRQLAEEHRELLKVAKAAYVFIEGNPGLTNALKAAIDKATKGE